MWSLVLRQTLLFSSLDEFLTALVAEVNGVVFVSFFRPAPDMSNIAIAIFGTFAIGTAIAKAFSKRLLLQLLMLKGVFFQEQ